MKAIRIMSALALLFSVALQSHAQPSKDFFVGKWKVTVTSDQMGELEMDLALERIDGKLTGKMSIMGGEIELSSIEERGDSIIIQVEAMGNPSTLTLTKNDDDHITGNSSSGSELKGERLNQ